MNLLEVYGPRELARITWIELQERKELRKSKIREINDYHYRAVGKSIEKRRRNSK